MADVTLANIITATTDTDVATALGGLTIPPSTTPAEFFWKVLKAYRAAQDTANASLSAGSQIGVMSVPAYTGVLAATDGSFYVQGSITLNIQLPVDEDNGIGPAV
jgi:hypothetical protein